MTYYSVVLRFEENPSRRTQWHPLEPEGPFCELTRGAFDSTSAAHAWARRNTPGARYAVRAFEGAE